MAVAMTDALFLFSITEVRVQPVLAHGGGLDELLVILGLVGLPLLVLVLLARRVKPDDGDDEIPVE